MNFDLDFINKKLEIKYYKSLKLFLGKNNYDNNSNIDWLNNHIDNLISKLPNDNDTNDKTSDTQTQTQIDKKKELIETSSETESHKQIFADEDLYKKPWQKLNSIHKILKIKEFVNNLKISSEKDRALLKDELVLLVKTKVLTKKEKVNYDEVNGKIISLNNLEYKDGKYFHLQS